MKVKFIGAAEGVTGSKHLLLTDKGRQILLDCGLYQGRGKETDKLNRKLDLDPLNIDAVILSHGHIDHSGNLPLLVKHGFTGNIYCTPATLDVCSILLIDSAYIHESDVSFINKQKRKKGEAEIEPLYTIEDAERCLDQLRAVEYNTDFQLNDEISFYFSENSHIIGSAAINISANESGKITRLTYTGDIGRYVDPILKPPAIFQQADHIICESTYGDRLHEAPEQAEHKLLDMVIKTCAEKKGKLIIPAFSLGRTQEILFLLDRFKNQNKLPDVKFFVDSPLSTKATRIVRQHTESYNKELQEYIKSDPDPFGFPGLKYIEDSMESKALNDLKEPCVIISASGMADAGRVKHHLRNNISDPRNSILLSGYCAPGTLGARLLKGDQTVKIFGDLFEVKAEVDMIQSFSAHSDYSGIIKFLSCQAKSKVQTIYLVHGETESKISMKEKLENEGYKKVVIPSKGDSFELGSAY
jgi:metallo-beta-lactamase family protein